MTISPYNRTQSFYHAEKEIKFEEPTFEAEWDPEAISQDEANKYVDDLEAQKVAQKEPLSPMADSQIVTRERIEANRVESEAARTQRTKELLLEFLDPKNDSI